MWQVQALLAHDRIREQLDEARRARMLRVDQEWAMARSQRANAPRRIPDLTDLRVGSIAKP
jgi:hypothetical protein